MLEVISKQVDESRVEAISFLQRLIRAPSPSGNEVNAAEVVAEGMRDAEFDYYKVDRLHDVMGTIEGAGGGRSVLLNGHIDHIPEGDMEEPYSGRLMDGAPFGVEGEVIYGRAASDMKGAMAAMVIAGKVLKELSRAQGRFQGRGSGSGGDRRRRHQGDYR